MRASIAIATPRNNEPPPPPRREGRRHRDGPLSEPSGTLVVILGPTATGKSEVAEHLAVALGGEVVGADSMQVYAGLDAGTAKPSDHARGRVPHHLIDVADPRSDFNLGDFVRAADRTVAEIAARGRTPIVAGGTGMYLRGLLRGIDPAPPRQPRLRAALQGIAARRGDAWLHRMLEANDPASAAGIGPADRMRLVRALERAWVTGRPAAPRRWSGPERYRAVKVGLEMGAADLRRRIDLRVDAMFAAGLVPETRRLLQAGVPAGGSALKALGYREVVEHLRGDRDLAETMALVKRRTWRFSRRQMTWFRSEPGVRWFQVPPDGPTPVCPEVENYVKLLLHLNPWTRGVVE